MNFREQAERLRLARIREQYKLNDQARRLDIEPRTLPASLTEKELTNLRETHGYL